MPGNIRLWGTSGYVELTAPAGATNQVLTLPTDTIQPGMALVTSQIFSAASSVSVNNCFTSTYDTYLVNIEMVNPAGASGPLRVRFRNGGSDRTDSTYSNAIGRYQSNNSFAGDAANELVNSAILTAGIVASAYTYLSLQFVTPNDASKFSNIMVNGYWTSTGTAIANALVGAITYATANANDGFTFYPSSGTITGNVRVYGYRNS